MKKGILYGVGVGPGDPELMTVKAVRILNECDIVIVPSSNGNDKTAFSIAEPYLDGKEIISCDMPMTRDKNIMQQAHENAADIICEYLTNGKILAFLTLGDPSIYSTYWYVHKIVLDRGFDAKIIPAVPSFCAAAASLNIALVEENEPLHIIPASHDSTEDGLSLYGTKVLMKAGKSLLDVCEQLRERGMLGNAALVERATMENEKVVKNLESLCEPTGYFSVVIVKEDKL